MVGSKEAPSWHKVSNAIQGAVRHVVSPGYLEVVGVLGVLVGVASSVIASNGTIQDKVNGVYPVVTRERLDSARAEITAFEGWAGGQLLERRIILDINTVAPDDPTYAERLRSSYEAVQTARLRGDYYNKLKGEPEKEFNSLLKIAAGGLLLALIGGLRQFQIHVMSRRNTPSTQLFNGTPQA